MERSRKGHPNVWRYFLVLSACSLTACEEGEEETCALFVCSNDSSAAPVPVENSQPDAPINSAPSISGQPAQQVAPGTNYVFNPFAHDPDGDRLTFSIRNKPAWASFEKVKRCTQQ